MQSQSLRAWKLRLTTLQGPKSQVPSPKYDMNVRLGTWVEQNAKPNSQHKSQRPLLHELIKIRLHDYKPYFNHGFLRLKSWDFASTSGLASMNGTWDPMWTGPWNSQHTLNTLSPISFKKRVFFGVRPSIPPNGHSLLKYR
jgi:hypothetical protein